MIMEFDENPLKRARSHYFLGVHNVKWMFWRRARSCCALKPWRFCQSIDSFPAAVEPGSEPELWVATAPPHATLYSVGNFKLMIDGSMHRKMESLYKQLQNWTGEFARGYLTTFFLLKTLVINEISLNQVQASTILSMDGGKTLGERERASVKADFVWWCLMTLLAFQYDITLIFSPFFSSCSALGFFLLLLLSTVCVLMQPSLVMEYTSSSRLSF